MWERFHEGTGGGLFLDFSPFDGFFVARYPHLQELSLQGRCIPGGALG